MFLRLSQGCHWIKKLSIFGRFWGIFFFFTFFTSDGHLNCIKFLNDSDFDEFGIARVITACVLWWNNILWPAANLDRKIVFRQIWYFLFLLRYYAFKFDVLAISAILAAILDFLYLCTNIVILDIKRIVSLRQTHWHDFYSNWTKMTAAI